MGSILAELQHRQRRQDKRIGEFQERRRSSLSDETQPSARRSSSSSFGDLATALSTAEQSTANVSPLQWRRSFGSASSTEHSPDLARRSLGALPSTQERTPALARRSLGALPSTQEHSPAGAARSLDGTLPSNLEHSPVLAGWRRNLGALPSALEGSPAGAARSLDGALPSTLEHRPALTGRRRSVGALSSSLEHSPVLAGRRRSLGALPSSLEHSPASVARTLDVLAETVAQPTALQRHTITSTHSQSDEFDRVQSGEPPQLSPRRPARDPACDVVLHSKPRAYEDWGELSVPGDVAGTDEVGARPVIAPTTEASARPIVDALHTRVHGLSQVASERRHDLDKEAYRQRSLEVAAYYANLITGEEGEISDSPVPCWRNLKLTATEF